MYKLYLNDRTKESCMVVYSSNGAFVPFDPANTDYANFKEQVLAGEAQLQDADGNTMSADDAKDFVKTLP